MYGERYALRGVDFDLYPGEVHAVVGDHYSGKTTLAKIVSGDVRKQHGVIEIEGREIPYMTPRLALRHHVSIVHQEMTVIPPLSAAENVFAGRFPFFHLRPRKREEMLTTARNLFHALGVDVDLEHPVRALSREERQMTEVARALAVAPRIVVLDEISQRFTPQQVDQIMLALRPYMDSGTAVLYVTSDIQEVLSRADRVTVLRSGVRRATERVGELDLFNLLTLTHNFALDVSLDEQQERVSLAKRYNEDMIANLSVGVVMLDENKRVFAINPAARDILDVHGPTEAELPVERLLFTDDPQGSKRILEDIEKGVQNTWSEVNIRNRRVVNVKLFPILEHNTHVGTMILLEDVSMDRSVKEYLERAERVTSIAELASGVAHEINNPLGIIQNYLELLKTHEETHAQQERLTIVEGELDRISRIVGSLLSFSRARTEDRRRVDLGELIEEVLVLMSHKIHDKHIHVVRDIPQERVVCVGDETRLKQVFMNLITNSTEAVLDSGTIEIRLQALPRTGYGELSITDDGHGIPPEIQEQIVSPFFSTKTYKKNAGLGLSISQHLVELHGGVLSFDSSPGTKTTFTVRLPLST